MGRLSEQMLHPPKNVTWAMCRDTFGWVLSIYTQSGSDLTLHKVIRSLHLENLLDECTHELAKMRSDQSTKRVEWENKYSL